MDTKRLIRLSNQRRKQAKRILADSNLLKMLSKYGNVTLIGGYFLDVMYAPDIDIVIKSDDTRKQSLEAFSEILDTRYFQKQEYGDFVEHPRDKRPRGYIVLLKTTIDNEVWEIEIWFLKDVSSQISYSKELKSKIDDDARVRILNAKHKRETSGLSKHQLNSYEIYSKILVK